MKAILESHMGDCAFALELLGYAYPHSRDMTQANLLRVRLTAKNMNGSWSAEATVLLTREVEDLVSWCRGGFLLEPLLQFRDPAFQLFVRGVPPALLSLNVHLEPPLLPAWQQGEQLEIELIIDSGQLWVFGNELEANLADSPFRDCTEEH